MSASNRCRDLYVSVAKTQYAIFVGTMQQALNLTSLFDRYRVSPRKVTSGGLTMKSFRRPSKISGNSGTTNKVRKRDYATCCDSTKFIKYEYLGRLVFIQALKMDNPTSKYL